MKTNLKTLSYYTFWYGIYHDSNQKDDNGIREPGIQVSFLRSTQGYVIILSLLIIEQICISWL